MFARILKIPAMLTKIKTVYISTHTLIHIYTLMRGRLWLVQRLAVNRHEKR